MWTVPCVSPCVHRPVLVVSVCHIPVCARPAGLDGCDGKHSTVARAGLVIHHVFLPLLLVLLLLPLLLLLLLLPLLLSLLTTTATTITTITIGKKHPKQRKTTLTQTSHTTTHHHHHSNVRPTTYQNRHHFNNSTLPLSCKEGLFKTLLSQARSTVTTMMAL